LKQWLITAKRANILGRVILLFPASTQSFIQLHQSDQFVSLRLRQP
jgi:hypothetical protein